MATIEKYGAPGVYDPPGYSQAIKVAGAGTILFTAGQVPYDADGGTLGNVVKIRTYVTDVRYRRDFRTVRDEFFGVRGAGVHDGGGIEVI